MRVPLCRFMTLAMASFALFLCANTAHAFEDSMAQRTRACTACHGAQGKAGPDGYYPRLAGKPAGYLYNQLVNFREGRRQYTLMAGLIAPLSDAYLQELAQYFSALDLPYERPQRATGSEAELARGRTLATRGDPAKKLPACIQCHGEALTGVAPNIPGLLGLPRDYLNAQLGGWQTGQRQARAPDCMASIAKNLDAADVSALAQWLSAQALPVSTKPATRLPPRQAQWPDIACGSAP